MSNLPSLDVPGETQRRLAYAGLQPVGDPMIDELAAALVWPGLDTGSKQAAMKRATAGRSETPLARLLVEIRQADANRTANLTSVSDKIADLGPQASTEQIADRLGVERSVLEATPSAFAAAIAVVDLSAGRKLDEATQAILHEVLGVLPR